MQMPYLGLYRIRGHPNHSSFSTSMDIRTVPFKEIPQLSERDVAYATAQKPLRPFYKYDVRLEAFAEVISDKEKDKTDRATLIRVLREQYSQLEMSDAVARQLDALERDNTFTVTTAHQPALFTGPLYYVYKIFSTIHLAHDLNTHYPDYHVVPMFVNGAEDHDFEEVNHTYLFGNRLTWTNDETGAVGAMSTKSLVPALEELQDILGDSDIAREVFTTVRQAYTEHETYAEATQHLVNALFGKYGLVTINMNHPALKRLFIPLMEKELTEQPSKALVEETCSKLEAIGFDQQAHARPINLFYLRPNLRARIVQENGEYAVVDTDYAFSKSAMLEELHQHPERFSPNVVMRPLFQELILPNLAYIGGGGELAYWLERKSQFEHFGLNFPMLIRRNSALVIDRGSSKRMDKLELDIEDLFRETDALIKEYVRKNTENEVSLSPEKKALAQVFEQVVEKAQTIDKSLVKATKAEMAKAMNSLDGLEAKLLRAEKNRHDIAINQIRSLRDKLFPGDGLQERHDNFLTFYLRYGDELFELLLQHLDPLKQGMLVFRDKG